MLKIFAVNVMLLPNKYPISNSTTSVTSGSNSPVTLNLNFSVTGELDPEVTDVVEFEMGYLLGSNMTLTANIFSIKIENPIVYDAINGEQYDNYSQAGTSGFETE